MSLAMAAGGQETVYQALSADEPSAAPIEMESLCMNCYKNGTTRLMSTTIPYYKAVILMSFECPHCGYRNNEIQSGEPVQEHGTEITLNVTQPVDIRRQLVKSEFATIEVPSVQLTIPPKSQPGEITTVEGVIQRVIDGLQQEQEERRKLHPELAEQIEAFLARLAGLIELKESWKLVLHDPTGNCYIQNPEPMHVDSRCIISHYHRSLDEMKLLGLADDNEVEELAGPFQSAEETTQEVLHFPTNCDQCGAPGQTLMKPTEIPFFQMVIIMSFSCDVCGHKTNEVKSGGPIRDHGCRIELQIREQLDLARDVLKSDTCNLEIPELELEVGYGALSGRFTTVEGLLIATKEQLGEQFKFFLGDSADENEKIRISKLLDSFDLILALKLPVTIILDDAAGNSYIQSLSAPLDDPRLKKNFYTRTFEQNDDLGLNDMKVENYGEMDAIEEGSESDGDHA